MPCEISRPIWACLPHSLRLRTSTPIEGEIMPDHSQRMLTRDAGQGDNAFACHGAKLRVAGDG